MGTEHGCRSRPSQQSCGPLLPLIRTRGAFVAPVHDHDDNVVLILRGPHRHEQFRDVRPGRRHDDTRRRSASRPRAIRHHQTSAKNGDGLPAGTNDCRGESIVEIGTDPDRLHTGRAKHIDGVRKRIGAEVE